MTYTEEQLQQIDQFASIYLRPTDIAVILGVRIEEFKQDIQDESNPAFTLALQTARENLLDMEDDE